MRAAIHDVRTKKLNPLGSRRGCPFLSPGFDEGEKGVLEAGMTRSGLAAQLVQIPLGYKSPGDHHADAIGHSLGNVQDVRRHNHGTAGLDALAQHPLDQAR